MVDIVRWEWRYCGKHIWRQLLVLECYPLVIFLLYHFHKEVLFRIASGIFSLPKEVYAFMGVNYGVTTGNILFYVLFGVMLLNIWVVWNACWRTLQLVQADERTGSIFSMCGQWYTRKQLCRGKVFCALVAFLIQNTLWYGVILLITLLGSANGQQRLTALHSLALLWFRSFFVVSMLIVLTFCLGVFLRHPVRTGMRWVNFLLILSLLIGNLYKVQDALGWLFVLMEWDVPAVFQKMKWLEWGYWLSPLSWLNPYRDIEEMAMLIQICVCITVSALGIGIGLRGYGGRRIF